MWFGLRGALVARGLIAIAFGWLLMAHPTISLEVFILLFGAFVLIDGTLILAAGLLGRPGEPGRAVALCLGAAAMAVGVATFLWPGVTGLVLVVLVALRALLVGLAELMTAMWLRHESATGAWLVGGAGIVSLAFGTFLILYPSTGLLALVWILAVYALAIGAATIARASLLTVRASASIALRH